MAGIWFGTFVPQGWKMDLVAVSDDPQAKWARTVEVATLADELGYDSIWVYDHFHNVPRPAHETVFECWTTLAALAAVTSRVRLGQLVSCTSYRNPSLTAKITSHLDVISGGRLIWGVGAGWYDNEYRGYGYEFAAAKDRIGMLAEAVEIVRSMWTEPETTYEGRYYRLERANCDPKPLQRPAPPVLIGGSGEQLTLRVVARLADLANWGGKPEEWQHKRDVLRGHCEAIGRDESEIEKTWNPDCVVRESEAEIRRLHDAGVVGSMWGEPYESWVAGNLVGTPEQVAEKVRRYAELGCRGFVPWFRDFPDLESMHLLAGQVMPEFAEA